MARRTGNTPKCVEEKRRQLPIYQHYILSPGKTKSHHPEAKCVHCLKEFVCGSKQRLIRHIRKCNSISNAEQIIAETLNTLARGSATGQLNHSILEASNLLPSQISHIQHSATQQLVGQAIHHHQNSSTNSTTVTTASSMNNIINNNNNNNGSNNNHNTSGSNDPLMVATSYNVTSSLNDPIPVKKPQKRGRKPGNHASAGPGIHVTTGMDGKTHFSPATQLPQGSGQSSSQMISPSHNGRPGQINYAYQAGVVSAAAPTNTITSSGAHMNTSHLSCATPNHHQSTPFKLNSELIDKAYLKLVLTRNLPLSLCDTKEFQAWVKTFANDYKPPSSINLIAQNMKHEAQSAKQRVSNILVKTSKKTINLELHSLPDDIRGHSWYAMIAGVDHKRFLISVRDMISQMNQRMLDQSADVAPEKLLKDFIDDCIKRVGSDRVNSLILTGKGNSDDATVERACQSLYTTHPSIVTYHCWWHFTNLLCSDIIETNEIFLEVLGNSNLLIDYIIKRPQLNSVLEKFSPFIGAPGALHRKRDDYRWYSHLVCYLLEYIKNNNEAITSTLVEYSSTKLLSDNNNNNDSHATGNPRSNAQQNNSNSSTQLTPHIVSCHEDPQLVRVKSIVISEEFWANLNSALVYLSSFRDVVALAQNMSSNSNGNARFNSNDPLTSAISPITCNNLSLSDYMNWFLKYGKSLIDSWKQSADSYKYQLIGRFFQRFDSTLDEFKLLFAAYLLNPKHRCAYMTQRAKDSAIEEILNIASEFMPEESDGHTIFDQWKLYLVREQPYDVVFDENRSTPLEWWMSIPCAESIRRVALRILRLKAFSSPKPDTLFSQLYFYEDETRSNLTETTFEDIAILRYFYDHEDKIGQPSLHNSAHNHTSSTHNHANNPLISNGFCDRTLAGQVHSDYVQDTNTTKLLPSGSLESPIDSNGRFGDHPSISDERKSFVGSFSDVTESYMNHTSHLDMDNQSSLSDSTNLALDNLPYYDQFSMYIDFNDSGIQIVEEPVEKKRRKWTAQEILSKCHSNHLSTNNNNHDVK